MKKKRLISLVFIILGLVFIILGVLLSFKYTEEENVSNPEPEVIVYTKKEQEIKNIIDNVFLNKNSTSSDIDSITGESNGYIVIGNDSYLKRKLDDSIMNENGLNVYRNKQLDYASKVEEKYLSNIKYNLKEDSMGNVEIDITSWYFSLYCSDVNLLKMKLMQEANVDMTLVETNYKEFSIYEYKARIVAMKIINDYLDNYNNKNEIIKLLFEYENDIPANNQYYSLYNNLIANTSIYMPNTDDRVNEQKNRVDDYYNNAIAKGIIKKDNLFAI